MHKTPERVIRVSTIGSPLTLKLVFTKTLSFVIF